MKKYLFHAFLLLPSFMSAQNNLKITSGTVIKTSVGVVINLQDMNLDNDGTINQAAGEGFFKFTGTQNNSISGISLPLFDVLDISKTGSAKLSLNRNISIGSSINFTSGLIDLNNNNILLQSNALLNGENVNSRITGTNGGFVEITQTLNAPGSANPGKLGAIFSSAQNFGSTLIRRGHKSQANGVGNGNSIFRYYDITPTNNSTLNATLRFNYFDSELNGLIETGLVFWKSADNTHWFNQSFSGRDIAVNYVEKTGIPDFSRWTLSSPSNPLPVSFTFINTRCENGKIYIVWKTAQEFNSSSFDIERSSNGINWSVIGSVFASGNSTSEKTYSFTDNIPNLNSGYYRIAENSFDGKKHFTNVVRGSCDAKEGISLWPNPVRDIALLNINITSPAHVIIKVYNTKGSLLLIQKGNLISGNNQLYVPMGKFIPGVYEIKVEYGIGKVKSFKLVKF